ncbi:MAG: ABC transporter permease [Alkaliphilus sp.]
MKILQIMYYTLLGHIRDKQSMAMMVLLPITLILLLGTALSAAFSAPEMEATKVAFFNNDDGEMSRHFEAFLENEEITELLNVTQVTTFKEGQSLVEERSVRAFISISEDYSKYILRGEEAKINILFAQGDNFRQSLVTNIVGAFNNEGNTINALMKLGVFESEHMRRNIIKNEPITKGNEAPRAIDYYAVTMLVMTIMYGSMYTAEGIATMKERPVGKRVKTTSAKSHQIFTGVTLASFLIVFMQALVLVFFTRYVYGVNWGASIAVPILMVLLMTLLSSSIGMAAATLIPSANTTMILLNIAIPALTFIAGGYIPLGNTDGIFAKTQQISPNLHMQNALFNYIFEGDSEKLIRSVIALAGITILMFAITFIARRRYTNDSV